MARLGDGGCRNAPNDPGGGGGTEGGLLLPLDDPRPGKSLSPELPWRQPMSR